MASIMLRAIKFIHTYKEAILPNMVLFVTANISNLGVSAMCTGD